MPRAEISSSALSYIKTDLARFITADDLATAVDDAIIEHSINRPPLFFSSRVSDGAVYQPCSAPVVESAPWTERFSEIKSIEYPVGNAPRTYLDDDSFKVVPTIDGDRIEFGTIPQSGASYVLAFTVPFLITETASMANKAEEIAISYLAASKACLMLAAKFGHSNESQISADSVNYQSKRHEFKDEADRLREEYIYMLRGDVRATRAGGKSAGISSGLDIESRMSSTRMTSITSSWNG